MTAMVVSVRPRGSEWGVWTVARRLYPHRTSKAITKQDLQNLSVHDWLRDGLDNSLTNVEMTKRFFIRFSRFLFSGISRGHIESRGGGRVTCIDTPPRPRPSYGALHGQPERPRGYREERST